MTIRWPTVMCYVCRKPVAKLTWWEDRDAGRQYLRASCHGQEDTMWVAPYELSFDVAQQLNTSTGWAFVPAPPPPPPLEQQ